jgi:hypothetical protein
VLVVAVVAVILIVLAIVIVVLVRKRSFKISVMWFIVSHTPKEIGIACS